MPAATAFHQCKIRADDLWTATRCLTTMALIFKLNNEIAASTAP
jgi:hypothetical protein